MGSIPEFITKQLASSVTGTLGVDTSGAQLGQTIAKAGATIAELGFKDLAERKHILNVTEAESKQREFDIDIANLVNDIQKDFRDNPEEALKEIETKSNLMSDKFLSNITNPKVRQFTAIRIEQAKTQKSKQLQAWSFNQEVINFGKHLETSVETMGEVVNNSTSFDVFNNIMKDAENLFASGRAGLSTENASKFEDGTKQFLAERFLANLLEEDPIQARELLGKDVFVDLLPTKRQEFYEVQVAENAFMVEANENVKLAVANVEANPNLTPLEKVNTTNKWFNLKAAWDKNLSKVVKEKQEEATSKIFSDIQDDVITDISVLRSLSRGFELPYKVRKSLEQDFEDKISGKTVDNAIAYNYYFDELTDGVPYSHDMIMGFKDVSPENRLKLLEIRSQLIRDPVFKNELYIESKKLMNELYKVGLLDKIDLNFQNKKVAAKWDYLQAIIARRKLEGKNPENENRIIIEEFDKARERIEKERSGGIKIRTTDEKNVRRRKLLQKVLNQTATAEDKDELRRINEGR